MNTTITNRQKWAIAAVIIAVIFIVLIVIFSGKKPVEAPTVPAPQVTETTAVPVKKPVSTKPEPVSAPVPTKGMSRKTALATYQNHIVRVSDTCVAATEPQSFVVPAGTTFMIDNDGNQSHQVTIGNRTLTLASKNYSLETLKEQAWVSSTCDPKTGLTTVWIHS